MGPAIGPDHTIAANDAVAPPPRARPAVDDAHVLAATRRARASNALYRSNLAKGQTGLSIAFDLPTQTGYDADHELARGEVGKVGVPSRTRATCTRCSTASRSTR
jgi:methylmalonyl-CoA mutase N-terminal domain/subunit